MSPETIQAVKDAMIPVAEKIGQGAGYGWEVLVAGQFAEGIANLLICVAVIVTIYILGAKVIIPGFKKNRESSWADRSEIPAMLTVICGIISFVMLFVLEDAIVSIISPEYAAIKFLISSVSGAQ